MMTEIQLQERAKRKRNRLKGCYGMPTPKGARPREHILTDGPGWKPMPGPVPVESFIADSLKGFNRWLAWWNKRKGGSDEHRTRTGQ